MAKLILPPTQASYSMATPESDVIRIDLDGGAGRYIRDQEGGTIMVGCTWVLDEDKYPYFMAFWRAEADRGATPFDIDLPIDGTMTEVEARFMPGSVRLQGVDGEVYTVSATLEVTPPAEDPSADAAIIAAYTA